MAFRRFFLFSVGILFLLVALAVALGPWYTSQIADHALKSAIQEINRHGTFDARYQRIAYGWFGQEGRLILVPTAPKARQTLQKTNGSDELVLRLQIAYGPLPFASWGRDGVSLMPVGAIIDARLPGLEKSLHKAGSAYRLRDVVGLSGNSQFLANLQPGKLTTPDGAHMQWGKVRLEIDQNGGRINGQGHFGAFSLNATNGYLRLQPASLRIGNLQVKDGLSAGRIQLDWQGMSFNVPDKQQPHRRIAGFLKSFTLLSDTHFGEGVTYGRATLGIKAMEIRQPANAPKATFSMRDIRLQASSTPPRGAFMDSTLDWQAMRMEISGQQYAPVQLVITLDHQYVPALKEMMQGFRKLQAQARENAYSQVPTRLFYQRAIGLLMPSVQQFIAHYPVLRLKKLNIGTPEGSLQAEGEARLTPAGGGSPSLLTLPQDLVADLSLEVPPAIARHLLSAALERRGVPSDQLTKVTTMQLQQMQSAGWIKLEKGIYKTRIDYSRGAMDIYGHPVPLG